MSRFALVRGWLECSFEEVQAIREAVEQVAKRVEEDALPPEMVAAYLRGWNFPASPMNWVSLVFYGANINSQALPFVRKMIEAAASVGEEIDGLFHVDAEEAEDALQWTISDGVVSEMKRVRPV